MIDITKLGIYPNPSGAKTECGCPARIYATDAGGEYPIHGAIMLAPDTEWQTMKWMGNGRVDSHSPSSLDLVPIPQKLVGWVNVLKGRRGNIFAAPVYDNEEEAKLQISQADYVATIRIEYEPKDTL